MEIIAEAGINSCAIMPIAKQQIDMAYNTGCDAIKFQAYHTDKLYNGDTTARYYNDSQRAEFTHEQLRELYSYAQPRIEWFASVFDFEGIALMEDIGVKRYKIAYRSRGDTELLKEVSKTNKPVILSTDMDNPILTQAIDIFKNVHLTVLYCVPKYPTESKDIDFSQINRINKEYNVPVGFSDHGIGIFYSVEAVRYGACMIEKHITTDRNLPGPDQVCSIEEYELNILVKEIRECQ